MRSLKVLVASVAVAFPVTVGVPGAVAAPASPLASTIHQTFTGGGSGTDLVANGDDFRGRYSSSSQLGRGSLSMHVDETAGTAQLTRSDGTTMTGSADLADECGIINPPLSCIDVTLTGSADLAHAHLAVAMVPGAVTIEGHRASFIMHGDVDVHRRIGYALVDGNGGVHTFGGIDHVGDAQDRAAIAIDLTNSGAGYSVADTFGAVNEFGDATPIDHIRRSPLPSSERVTSIAATPTGNGDWLITTRGGALNFGDAPNFGDLEAKALNGSIVGAAASPTGLGYYMVGSDGGVFAFGDARFRGSLGGRRLNRPVVGIVPTADNGGYWLVASDGGVFSFGDARFRGSLGAIHLNRPIVSAARYADGYLMAATDGGIFNFSNGPFFGSFAGTPSTAPVVGVDALG